LKKRQNKSTEAGILRRKAEDQLKKQNSKASSLSPEINNLKLIQELKVHQIELEMQNEELVMAKEEAEAATQKYIQLYDFSPTGYFTLSEEGKIIGLNLMGAKMVGQERLHLINKRFSAFLSDDTKPAFNIFLGRVFKYGVTETCEVKLTDVSVNGPVYAHLTGIIAENAGNLYLTVIDITKEKMSELALKEKDEILTKLNADKNRFISILGHDLRSPFSNILGLSQVLADNVRKFDIAETEDVANTIYRTAQNTYILLEDILLWARSQSGRIPYKPQKLIFTEVCHDIVHTLSPNAVAKNISLKSFVKKELTVLADVDMLKTVLRNLISNSIKFTKNGGAIYIDASENSDHATISVSDNGIGIEPENINKLFDISCVFTTPGTADESGTGLGLLLCQEFVARLGGKIRVKSEAGKGSDFIFTLPLFSEL
jgi:signal transduction histidine kinase